ncbi:COG4315 family predicted lipoprotein [Rhodococcus sp. BE178]|uniref:COG4315 family predicted lipoprotein n=1 Tax=Rhodococcus sp. BE178 TaxID=2817737 RepID=UPI003D25F0DF
MKSKKSIIAAVCAGTALVLTSGCGANTDEQVAAPAMVSTSAAPAVTSTTAAPTGGLEIGTAETALGTVLTDGDGFTLYRFDEDVPGAIKCTGQCAEIWPPAIGAPQAAGPLSGALGTAARPDGTTQATYDGQPLYRFAKDTAPGQTSGDGVKGTWHVVRVDTADE